MVIEKKTTIKAYIQREQDIAIINEIHHKHPSHGYRWINAYAKKNIIK